MAITFDRIVSRKPARPKCSACERNPSDPDYDGFHAPAGFDYVKDDTVVTLEIDVPIHVCTQCARDLGLDEGPMLLRGDRKRAALAE